MSSHAIARRDVTGTELAAVPQGARQLGARVKPIIRLGMGIKDPNRGFPRKTDYLTVRGDERACAKFKTVYGEQPKAVKLMVPSSLSLALDISYRSFVGGGDGEDGGRPLALGMTNFAPLGYVGGRDVLRVWKQNGDYVEVETEGLDELGKPLDDIAADLKIEVHTTFTFTIPDVLGWGSFAQITSKGKKSADNLAFKLTEIYTAFGHRAPFAFSKEEPPLLVLKPDTALMRFEDKQTHDAKWAKTKIFVLDIVIPESFQDMSDRIVARQRELAAASPADALYGREDRPALGGGAVPASSAQGGRPADAAGGADGTGSPTGPGAVDADHETVDEADVEIVDDELAQAALAAADAVPPYGVHSNAGRTLAQILELQSGGGAGWFRGALRKQDLPAEFRAQLYAFAQIYLPDVYAEIVTPTGDENEVDF